MFLMSKTPINAVLIGGSEGLTIGVSGAVNVTIVSVGGLVLDVCGVNGDTTSHLFRGLVNLSIVGELGTSLLSKSFCDGSSQSSLSVIDVTLMAVRVVL